MTFDNAFIGFVLVYCCMIMRCNRRFDELFGYGSGELNNSSTLITYSSDDDCERIGLIYYEYRISTNSVPTSR